MPDRIEEIAGVLQSFEEERQETLRLAGKNDPPVGAPLRHQISRDPNDVVMIEPGKWDIEGWANERTGLPPGCPVIPLGKDGQTCFFLDTMNKVFELDARSSGKGPIGSLFAGRSRYLEWAWPRFSAPKEDRPPQIIGWQADDARQCLTDACAFMGPYEHADQIRGRGAWKDMLTGKLVLHCGDRVLIDGRWEQPGEHGGLIYPARPRIGKPSARRQPAGMGSAGDELLEMLKTFRWDRPEVDPRLVLGWVMTAKVGGALDRRPVLFVHGGEGSGKSTLQELLRLIMNGALIATADTSQAGIYHHLGQDSVAILVDELEAKDDSRNVDKILALARIAYSGDKMLRGTKEGAGKEFTLMSSFMASAVNKPATEAQDDSRMAVVMLREREQAGGKLDVTVKSADAIGRHLLRRWVDWWPRWAELLQVFRGALIAPECGHNDRGADTFAPLAAACHVALRDEMPEPGELTDWQAWLNPRALIEIKNRERTWRRVLVHLLNAQVEPWRLLPQKSIGALLLQAKLEEDKAHANGSEVVDDAAWWITIEERFAQLGMAVSWRRPPARFDDDDEGAVNGQPDTGRYSDARIFVPANSPGLQAIFDGTSWAGRRGQPGPWCNALRQAPPELWHNGKCGKGLDRKASGIFIYVARALEA